MGTATAFDSGSLPTPPGGSDTLHSRQALICAGHKRESRVSACGVLRSAKEKAISRCGHAERVYGERSLSKKDREHPGTEVQCSISGEAIVDSSSKLFFIFYNIQLRIPVPGCAPDFPESARQVHSLRRNEKPVINS